MKVPRREMPRDPSPAEAKIRRKRGTGRVMDGQLLVVAAQSRRV